MPGATRSSRAFRRCSAEARRSRRRRQPRARPPAGGACWPTGSPAGQPADRPRDGQPRLAVPFRPRASSARPSNFGYQGTPPTHPELLDWLASEFVADGWTLKPLHRLILTSNAYRMSSGESTVGCAEGPGERSALAVRHAPADRRGDARLDPGRQRQPEPEDVTARAFIRRSRRKCWPASRCPATAGAIAPGGAGRRSVYVHVKRSLAVPLLAASTPPTRTAPCPVRFTPRSRRRRWGCSTATFVNEQAKVFADAAAQGGRARRTGAGATGPATRARSGRPTPARRSSAACGSWPTLQSDGQGCRRRGAAAFCLLALNLNEFMYLD